MIGGWLAEGLDSKLQINDKVSFEDHADNLSNPILPGSTIH